MYTFSTIPFMLTSLTHGRVPMHFILQGIGSWSNTNQRVVTPIGAILKAATGDTICVRLNLAVTP